MRNGLRWHQGQNDPNPSGWKTIDRLAQVDPSWFCRLVPDETRPIRFAVIDGDTGSVETFTTLILKRVAGQAQRITFKEADTDDTDDGEPGASARFEAEACDSLANSRAPLRLRRAPHDEHDERRRRRPREPVSARGAAVGWRGWTRPTRRSTS